jgi:hypothetical protein
MAKWTEKTKKHTEPLVPSGYETRIYRDGKPMGKALGRTPQESRDRAIDRALKKAETEKRNK